MGEAKTGPRAPVLARCSAALAAAWTIASPTAGFAASCADLGTVLSPACRRIVDTYENGRTGVLLSGYAWHLPSTWTAERRAELNSNAWGGGLVRTTEDEKGDSRSVFLLAFLDSHENYTDGRAEQPGFRTGAGCLAPGATSACFATMTCWRLAASLQLDVSIRNGVPDSGAATSWPLLMIGLAPDG